MYGKPNDKMPMTLKATAFAILLAACLSFEQAAQAQFANPLVPPGGVVTYNPANAAPPAPPPHAPGSGAANPAVILGEQGASPTVPNNGYDTTTGNIFASGASHDPTIVYLYHQQVGDDGTARGLKMAMTLSPDSLAPDVVTAIDGIIGGNMLDGQPVHNIQVTDQQLAQIQQVLYPYPIQNTATTFNDSTTLNGKTVINQDNPGNVPAAALPQPSYNWQPVLPTVHAFCRYLVILGVVVSTIWMAMAAFGMTMGLPYAGSRAIGTATGLIMLLCAFTIWRIVQMNTINANTDPPAVINADATGNAPPSAAVPLPPVPNVAPYPARDGLPVQPLVGKDGS
jgi:hypothetical protein